MKTITINLQVTDNANEALIKEAVKQIVEKVSETNLRQFNDKLAKRTKQAEVDALNSRFQTGLKFI